MTSQNAQIQALLQEIDEALSKASPRLPWVMSNDAAQQRQALEQARQYLSTLQLEGDQLPSAPVAASGAQLPSESAQQVLQAVLQEMNYWRVNMLQPLRNEVDSLQHQRERLTQEIRQLEAQRQQQALPRQNQQLVEFLQSAMAQMQANLAAQVRQMNASSSTQLPLSIEPSDLNSIERLTQMQQAQAQSDQLMLKLDSTLQIIFESLNRNVETYQESLEQGLNRMHSLGQQGEAMFAFLVNRLAQQLGREASSFLQASEWPQNQSLPGEQQSTEFTVADFLSQPPQATATNSSTSFAPPIPFNLSEEVLDIADLEAEEALPDINQLVGLDHELQQLDLNALSADLEAAEPFELFTGDRPLPSKLKQSSEAVIAQSWQSNASDLDSALDLLNQLSAEMQTSLTENSVTVAPVAESDRADLVHTAELITDPDSLYSDSLYNDDFYDNFSSSGEDSAQDLAQDLESSTSSTAVAASADTPDLNQLTAEWFDGLADPATTAPTIQTTSEEAADATNTAHAVSQSLESRLLNNPAPAATDSTNLAADLAAQTSSDAAMLNAAMPNAAGPDAAGLGATVETIARLTDLIPSSEAAAVESSTESPVPFADRTSVTETQPPADQLASEDPLLVVEAASQPALDLGMTVEALESLGDTASPALSNAVSAEDTAIDPEKKN